MVAEGDGLVPDTSAPMRVAVVHNLKPGGAARRLAGTVGAISQLGIELREFALEGPALQLLDDQNCERVAWSRRAPQLPSLLRPPARYLDHRALLTAWTAASRRVNAWVPDVVFANPCMGLVGTPAALHLIKAPVVYYCDEPRRVDYEPAAAASRRGSTKVLYDRLHRSEQAVDRRGIDAATAVLTNSAYSAERIMSAYGRSATVVPPGVNHAFCHASNTSAVTHVLTVGSLIPTKGHDLVIRANAMAATGLPVVVAGPRHDADEEQRLRSIANETGVDLQFRIGVDDDELADLYRGALATVYLARSEPLGLVSLESQATGTPVIVADEGGLAGTVEQGVSGFRVDRTAQAAAEALRGMGSVETRAVMTTHLRGLRTRRDEASAADVLAVLRQAIATDRHENEPAATR